MQRAALTLHARGGGINDGAGRCLFHHLIYDGASEYRGKATAGCVMGDGAHDEVMNVLASDLRRRSLSSYGACMRVTPFVALRALRSFCIDTRWFTMNFYLPKFERPVIWWKR